MRTSSRQPIWVLGLAGIFAAGLFVLAAPWLGLGERYDFILYRAAGLSRGAALSYLLFAALLLLGYGLLSATTPSASRDPGLGVIARSALSDAWRVSRSFVSGHFQSASWGETLTIAALVLASVATFAVSLSKTLFWFKLSHDQHWWQAMVDYGLTWGTPPFSLGANVLYNFEIELPLKAALLPLEGAAHFLPIDVRVAGMVSLYFGAVMVLFWIIGGRMGMSRISRTLFAGIVANMVTIPATLDQILPVLPPNFFTHQFTLALWWGEAPLLLLVTAIAFLCIGGRRIAGNVAASAIFALGAFAAVLAYPIGAILFIPVLAFLCLGFLLTCRDRTELFWKIGTSGLILALMLVAQVPQYFINLYSYAFGSYFIDYSGDGPPSFQSTFLFASHSDDLRGLLIYVVAFVTAAVAARYASGFLRRIAVAVLICEVGIITLCIVNSLTLKLSLAGAYAELAYAPLWGSFFVLAMLVLLRLIDERMARLGRETATGFARPLRVAVRHRHWAYWACFVAVLGMYWVKQPAMTHFSDYPPKQPPSIQLLIRELALRPGSPFRGRLMVVVGDAGDAPLQMERFNEIITARYRLHSGNDHYLDVLSFNIPTANEYGYWTSPPTFALFRVFFGKPGEIFGHVWFTVSRFEPRIARLVGVRMLVTDAADVPGATLIYETQTGDTALRIFRLDGTNIGQYSPTRSHRVNSAAEAIARLSAPDFDPEREVIVEDEVPAGLVPATGARAIVERGAALVVRAGSTARSLLALPFEYSHCLRVETVRGSAQLLPVNLQQAGLLITGETEARITYRFGLFGDTRCRRDDRDRADRLRIKDMLVEQRRIAPTRGP